MLEADNLHNMLQGSCWLEKNAVGISEFGLQVQKSNMAPAVILNFLFANYFYSIVARIAKFGELSSEFNFR